MSGSIVNEALADRAIEWIVRLRADDVSEAKRNQFFQWLQQSRENQLAFVDTLQLWYDLSVVKNMNFEGLLPMAHIWDRKHKLEANRAG
jgi:ferric-dicitrate binding protein FerR (iron transport regulator)